MFDDLHYVDEIFEEVFDNDYYDEYYSEFLNVNLHEFWCVDCNYTFEANPDCSRCPNCNSDNLYDVKHQDIL